MDVDPSSRANFCDENLHLEEGGCFLWRHFGMTRRLVYTSLHLDVGVWRPRRHPIFP
jgi:hypothetical protein